MSNIFLLCSGVNKIMDATHIKAVLGQYKISEYQHNDIESNAYEVDIKQIYPHPKYSCLSPENDIGRIGFFSNLVQFYYIFNISLKPDFHGATCC